MNLSPAQKLLAGSAAVLAIAAFLPWVSILGISALGIEGDGAITLVAGLVVLAAVAARTGLLPYRPGDRLYLGVTGAAATVALLVALVDMNGFAAIGLYLTLFASIALAVGVVWEYRETKATSAEEPAG